MIFAKKQNNSDLPALFIFSWALFSNIAFSQNEEALDESSSAEFEGIYLAQAESSNEDDGFLDFDFDLSDLESDDELSSDDSGTTANNLDDLKYDFGGFVKQDIGYSFQREDFELSKIRTTLNLGGTYRFSDRLKFKAVGEAFYDSAYEQEGRDKFTEEALSVYESDLRVREAYVDGDITSWLNIRVGRQYFSWGETLGGQVSDIGNPRDLRELGLQHIEDARLSVGATKMTFYGSSWEYNLITIHEIRADEIGGRGSEFDPYLNYLENNSVILDADQPESSIANTELLTRLYLSQSWGDLSFFAGKVYEDIPVLNFIGTSDGTNTYQPVFNEIETFGTFGNIVSGAWIYTFEVARLMDSSVSVARAGIDVQIQQGGNVSTITSWEQKDRTQFMLGAEYTGFSSTTISLEYTGDTIDNLDEDLIFTEDDASGSLSVFYSRNMFREKLNATLWFNRLIDDKVNMYRFDLLYHYTDDLKLSMSVSGLDVFEDSSFFYDYRETDRVTFSVKYNL